MDASRPGLGVTDYPGNLVADIPKGYAMVLMAELERRRHGIEPTLPDLSRTAGEWLLANALLDPGGHVGWGVPIGWDAYGDGSVNPGDTVYGITTGIVVGALLDWMEADPAAPGAEILSVVEDALTEFANPLVRTPSGLIPYSLVHSDTAYDTFNSAAYIAGEMQRFAKYASTPGVARQLRDAADSTVRSLIDHRQLSPQAAWYWRYSIQENVANDLAHATYIAHGLRTYVEEGGGLAREVDLAAVVSHLNEFVDDGQTVRGWPSLEKDITAPARLYDLGMALVFGCPYPELDELTSRILTSIELYRDGDRFQRYPYNDQLPDIIVTEYENYLWHGLIACEVSNLADASREEGNAFDRGAGREPTFTNANSPSIPLVDLPLGGPVQTNLQGGELQFIVNKSGFQDIPLTLFDDGMGGVAVTREVMGAGMSIEAIGEGLAVTPLNAPSDGHAALEFRAGVYHEGALNLVIYDNTRQANFLTRWVRGDFGYTMDGEAIELPSLEDPAGRTYEMIPKVFLLPSSDGLWVVGGTLQAKWTRSGGLSVGRIDNCSHVIEAIATKEGPATLCVQRTEIGPDAPFAINAPPGIAVPPMGNAGVPFRLRTADDGRLAISMADGPAELVEMLAYDLGRLSNGWLEFGIENTEGRVPWSQLYYLNGFMDFLYQSERAPDRWVEFQPLLGDIRQRLAIEVSLLDKVWANGMFTTRAFSVDRSPQLFAVQTARLLLSLDRYEGEVGDVQIASLADLKSAVGGLRGHIEELVAEGQSRDWIPVGASFLKWPKGSAFYFDGLNVPYNHQNEWAYAVTRVGLNRAEAATDILSHFLRRVAPDGYLPMSGTWDYWWGKAYDGWTSDEAVSVNRPEYGGDTGEAWISFRSIDAMAVVSFADRLPPRIARAIRQSTARLVSAGKLYPFVSYELIKAGVVPDIPAEVARRYVRISSPWEVQNAAWAYGALLDARQ